MASKERGNKLLDALLEGKADEAIQLLKENVDFSLEKGGDKAIHLAARKGFLQIIKRMKEVGVNLQTKNQNGNTPVHYAARGGFVDLIRYFKENGCNLNPLNNEGDSPLHVAVIDQPMNIIEELVDLGMDPNAVNKVAGGTPLHTALKYGRQEAMEGLLMKGAKTNVRDKLDKRPDEVAQNGQIKESFKAYAFMQMALTSGFILAKGLKITKDVVSEPLKIDRVEIILESIDIPREFPTGFYCRRERPENATVEIKKFKDEHVFSDVFHIRIFDVSRDCHAKILLPLYKLPSDKEQLVMRFINQEREDEIIKETVSKSKINYCPLDTVLVPETTCTCVIYVRPKQEDNAISNKGQVITSTIEKEFSLNIPPNSFEGETVLSLKVFGTHDDNDDDSEVSDETNTNNEKKSTIPPGIDKKIHAKENPGVENTTLQQEHKNNSPPPNSSLLTDVYQINIAGQQPKKAIKMQIPLSKGMEGHGEDFVIVRADENSLFNEATEKKHNLEVLLSLPTLIGRNLIFEVAHFSVYVATWKKKASTEEDLDDLQRQIVSARDRRKPGNIFVVVKKEEDNDKPRKHVMVVECGIANKSHERRQKWLERMFEDQTPAESDAVMMTPGDTFCVSLEGNAVMEDESDSKERKVQFSELRPSFKAYHVLLNENIYSQDQAVATVAVSQQTRTGLKQVARLRIQLHAPPPPPPQTPDPLIPRLSKTNYETPKILKIRELFGTKKK